MVQSPVKGKKGKGAKNTGSADLQLAGVLHIMKLLGAPASTEADAAPVASPGGRRKSGTTKIEERPLQPEVVGHIVDALFDRCPHLLGGVVEDIAGFSKVWGPWHGFYRAAQPPFTPTTFRALDFHFWHGLLGLIDSLDISLCCHFMDTYLQEVWQVSWYRDCSLRCSVEVLQDWHAMVEALTNDQANQARGDAATTNLTMLLAAAVRSATSGAQVGTRTDARCVPTTSRIPCLSMASQWQTIATKEVPLFTLLAPQHGTLY